MELNEYQKLANKAKGTTFPDLIIRPKTENRTGAEVYQDVVLATSMNHIYPSLGLAGEAGEVIEKIKKAIRDDGGVLTPNAKEAVKKELGDVLWYLTQLGSELGFSLEEIAQSNLDKFADRSARGVVQGSGDDR